ncbi:MAG: nuclear transport factor 2 family protein [Halioglobus sp.]|nr:nuclear transport factor 2 family protein [Halioglobus sp.]
MDNLQTLLAIEEIKRLKARYFRCVDCKDWSGLQALFTPDAEFDMSGEMRDDNREDGRVRGAARIAAFIRSAVDDLETVHHGHTPEIDIHTADSARGIWAMEDLLRWPPGGPLQSLRGYGHYHETYERLDGDWHIKSSKLTRLRVDVVPAGTDGE